MIGFRSSGVRDRRNNSRNISADDGRRATEARRRKLRRINRDDFISGASKVANLSTARTPLFFEPRRKTECITSDASRGLHPIERRWRRKPLVYRHQKSNVVVIATQVGPNWWFPFTDAPTAFRGRGILGERGANNDFVRGSWTL